MSKKITLFLSAILLAAASMFAQTTNSASSEEHIFYVQCPTLNVENYVALHNRLNTDGRFVIETSCIPAHVLTIKVLSQDIQNASSEVNFQKFNVLAQDANLNSMSLLSGFTKQLFENQCLSVRNGN